MFAAVSTISPGRDAIGLPFPITEHSTSSPAAAGFDDRQRVVLKGILERGPAGRPGSATRAIPTDDPSRAGLTNTGRPSSAQVVEDGIRPFGEPGHRGGAVVDLGDPRAPHQLLEQHLVHADRTRLDAGADVGDVQGLQQSLDGAVLAERAVQNRKDHVGIGKAPTRA